MKRPTQFDNHVLMVCILPLQTPPIPSHPASPQVCFCLKNAVLHQNCAISGLLATFVMRSATKQGASPFSRISVWNGFTIAFTSGFVPCWDLARLLSNPCNFSVMHNLHCLGGNVIRDVPLSDHEAVLDALLSAILSMEGPLFLNFEFEVPTSA